MSDSEIEENLKVFSSCKIINYVTKKKPKRAMDVARFLDEIRKQKNLSINDISEITETAGSRFKIF
jgi:hypothetical protein